MTVSGKESHRMTQIRLGMFEYLKTKCGNILRLYIQEKLSAKSVCMYGQCIVVYT